MTDEQRALAEENHNLIYSFLRGERLPIEDWYGLAAIGLCEAAELYDPAKGTFSTIAYSCMRNKIYKQLKRDSAKKRGSEFVTVSLQEVRRNAKTGDDYALEDVVPSEVRMEDETVSRMNLKRVLGDTRDRDRKILLLLSDGMVQSEVAHVVGTSQATVSRIARQFEKRLMKD